MKISEIVSTNLEGCVSKVACNLNASCVFCLYAFVYISNYSLTTIMCFGPFARLNHWGPLTALGIIKVVTGMTIHCNNMWWPPNTTGGLMNTLCFMTLSGLTLYNFLSAVFHGPGYLPLRWKPKNEADTKFLQFCGVCQGYKAPRSHHCRKCGHCTIKMDHHCPWINNCVGWGNHAHFTAFLAFAVMGCFHATIILSCSLYRAIYRSWYLYYEPRQSVINFGLYGLITCVFALGLAIGVVFAVGMLLFFQIRAIVRNRTGIEDWIVDKAIRRRRNSKEPFIFPYNLGFFRNIRQVVNWSCQPVGDGINWEIAEGCDQYTLTREQIDQKAEKRQRTKLYHIIRPASGAWIPVFQGIYVCLNIPCSDEPRIKLDVKDTVLVTRWNKHWLFGEKIQPELAEGEQSVKRIRGWFPRRCAVQLVEPNSDANFARKIK